MREFQPPRKFGPRVFLAGSIEMNLAENWQKKTIESLADLEVDFLNPRRNDWDSSITQSVDDPRFFEQVDWEIENLYGADIIFMYFDPRTRSPISLLELGLFAESGKLYIVCPEGFWRKGNVDYMIRRFCIPNSPTLEQGIADLREIISNG